MQTSRNHHDKKRRRPQPSTIETPPRVVDDADEHAAGSDGVDVIDRAGRTSAAAENAPQTSGASLFYFVFAIPLLVLLLLGWLMRD